MTTTSVTKIDHNRVQIDGLVIDDSIVVEVAKEAETRGHNLDTWARTVVAIGARALRDASTATEAEAVRAGLDQLATHVTASVSHEVQRLGDRLDGMTTLSSERVSTAVEQQMTRLGSGVQNVLAHADSSLRAQVEDVLRQGLASTARAVSETARRESESTRAALERDASGIREAVSSGLSEVRALLSAERARGEVSSRTHLKGRPYEEQVRAALEVVGGPMGFVVEDTTLSIGEIPRAKLGDFVLQHSVNEPIALSRIAVEVKSGARLTSGRWQALLSESARNRNAGAAIGVVPSTEVLDGKLLRVLSPTAAVISFDPSDDDPAGLLAAVIVLMRAGALARETATSAGNSPDRSALLRAAEAVTRAAESLAPIARQAASLRKGAGDLHAGLEAARSELAAQISDLQRLLVPRAQTLPVSGAPAA